MSNGLNELILSITSIHEKLINEDKVNDLDFVLEYLENYESDVKDSYLSILLKYYFQTNHVQNFKELFYLGYDFELNLEDIKLAFSNISTNEESVIEICQESVVFLKYSNYEKNLKDMYEHYSKSDKKIQIVLTKAVKLLRKNVYICSYSYKNLDEEYAKFFLDDELLKLLKNDMPFLFP